jgi:TetR/AcrR family transcriptional repressor of mexJK operon
MGKDLSLKQKPEEDRRKPGRPTLTNEELLDTAIELFLGKGYERIGITEVAAAAGMAKRTVYARYEDKNALFKAALKRAIEKWIVPAETLRSAECESLEKTLLEIARLLLANILSQQGLRLLRLTNAVSGSMPEIAAYNTRAGTEPTLAHLADLFQRRLLPQDAPGPEAGEAALAFLHLVVGGPASTAAWGVAMNAEETERHIRYCVRLFLHGALPAHASGLLERRNRRLEAAIEQAAAEVENAVKTLRRASSG